MAVRQKTQINGCVAYWVYYAWTVTPRDLADHVLRHIITYIAYYQPACRDIGTYVARFIYIICGWACHKFGNDFGAGVLARMPPAEYIAG